MKNRWLLIFLVGVIGAIISSAVVGNELPEWHIRDKAQKFTVRIIGKFSNGTGVIVEKKDNTYTTITNCHVIGKMNNKTGICNPNSPRSYKIQTGDAQEHEISEIKTTEGADLAVVYFKSNNDYQHVAIVTNKPQPVSTKAYTFGYPGNQDINGPFFKYGDVALFLSQPSVAQGKCIGYQITVGVSAPGGMSGSPVLNNNGDLLGILCAATDNNTVFAISALYARELTQGYIKWTIDDNKPERPPTISIPLTDPSIP